MFIDVHCLHGECAMVGQCSPKFPTAERNGEAFSKMAVSLEAALNAKKLVHGNYDEGELDLHKFLCFCVIHNHYDNRFSTAVICMHHHPDPSPILPNYELLHSHDRPR